MKIQEAKKIIKLNALSWNDFWEWMKGQTLSEDNGVTIIPDRDVKSYIDWKLKGIKPIWD